MSDLFCESLKLRHLSFVFFRVSISANRQAATLGYRSLGKHIKMGESLIKVIHTTLGEVRQAVLRLKANKASGVDEVPGEVLKNAKVTTFLHQFFNVCFESGKIPETWSKGIINPIPKASTSDPRNQLSYRGITLSPVTYKVYCTILNERLVSWNEQQNIILDEFKMVLGKKEVHLII